MMKIYGGIIILLIIGALSLSIQNDLNNGAKIKACRAAQGTPVYDLDKRVICLDYFAIKASQ